MYEKYNVYFTLFSNLQIYIIGSFVDYSADIPLYFVVILYLNVKWVAYWLGAIFMVLCRLQYNCKIVNHLVWNSSL